jgi:hypothetical protein
MRVGRGAIAFFVGGVAALASLAGWANPVVVKPIAVSGSSSAIQTMVNLIVASDGGITLVPGSAQYTGAAWASGIFVNGGSNLATTIGINNGIVLTTGDARFVAGSAAFPGDLPNKAIRFTSGVLNSLTRNAAPGSALFAGLTTAPTYNASILRFQFIPTGSQITLKYVFGSEDYNDGVNSPLPVDVLGFFVNGVNYAVVPGTSTPISAATVNCGGPTSGAANGANPSNCNLYRDNPAFVGNIETELNGLTVLLQLTAPVIPGQINTIELGIANTFDTFFDSAVFIEAGSLRVAP